MSAALHRHTPTLGVVDARSMPVRQVRFCRSEMGGPAEIRVDAQHYDISGRPTQNWDARLFAQRHAGEPVVANTRILTALSGVTLATDNVDAGWRLSLANEGGLAIEAWDGRGSHWRRDYDTLSRLTAIQEQVAGQPQRTAQRITYSGCDTEAVEHNRCGCPRALYDDAGLSQVESYNLFGQPLDAHRRFLLALDPPDWPVAEEARAALLEPKDAVTRYRYDAVGGMSVLEDARGHSRHFACGVYGQLRGVDLVLSGGIRQTLLSDVHCDAMGQVVQQSAGNGVCSRLAYDEVSGRLTRMTCTRRGKSTLQDVEYHQDPVGNILRIYDHAQPTRHFANQRLEPTSQYGYDSLYQLRSATGRETASAAVKPELPNVGRLPVDESQLLNYTQHYQYDAGGNLLELRHQGHTRYTRRMAVAANSNRALPVIEGHPSALAIDGFDANGNLLALALGQPLQWDARNQLQRITPVRRTDGDDDDECYAYDTQGNRLRKTSTSRARAIRHLREVRYLPGLELRSDTANRECLEVVSVQAGLYSIRCLHWASGKPDDIANDQLRYGLGDHLGSTSLEVDAGAELISHEGYYPYGGTAWWAARSAVEARYKTVRYSGKERDGIGLYYYGLRYYAPWLQRWISADPLGAVDGLNLYRMVRNNPISFYDSRGAISSESAATLLSFMAAIAAVAMLSFWWFLRRMPDPEQVPSPPPSPARPGTPPLAETPAAPEPEQSPTAVPTGAAPEIKLRTPTPDQAQVINNSISRVTRSRDLNSKQLLELKDWMTSSVENPDTVEMMTHDGAFYAYDLAKEDDYEFFAKNLSRSNFPSLPEAQSIPHIRLTKPGDGKRYMLLPTTPEISSARSSKSGSMSGSSRSGSMDSGSGRSSFSSTAYDLDTNDFLASKNFEKSKAAKFYGVDATREAVMKARKNYIEVGGGNLHSSIGGLLSLDLPGLGDSKKRGDWRLLFQKPVTGNVLRAHSIANHKDMKR